MKEIILARKELSQEIVLFNRIRNTPSYQQKNPFKPHNNSNKLQLYQEFSIYFQH